MKLKWGIILIIFTFVFSNKVFASTTTTSGEVPNNDNCGYYSPDTAVGQTNKCCNTEYDFDKLKGTLQVENFGCLPWPFDDYCMSTAITKAATYLNSKLTSVVGIDTIREVLFIPQCKEGIARGSGDSCICVSSIAKMCDRYLSNSSEYSKCDACMSNSGYYSAIGCVKFNNFGIFITNSVLTPLLSFGGIVTFLLIIYSAILVMTSSGDPEKIKKAKEILTSALLGLIFVILSIFILKFISGDLLGIKLTK